MATPAGAGYEIKESPSRGFGIFATSDCQAGTQVFTDHPVLVLQHSGNRRVVAACANCMAFVGPLQTQLEVLFNEARFAPLAEALNIAGVIAKWDAVLGGSAAQSVRCAQGCGEIYCSDACRTAHFSHSHNLLCTGPITTEDHPLIRFKYHALEHADTLLLAAQAMSFLVNRAKASGGGADVTRTLMQELLRFCHGPFRDVCRAPPGRPKDAEFYANTDNLISEAALLLKTAFEVHAPEETAALFEGGAAFLSELLGLFELNNIDVDIPSPVGPGITARGRALLEAARAQDAAAVQEAQLLERLLREKEWLMRCVWGEETTGIFGDDEDRREDAKIDAIMAEAPDDDTADAKVAGHAMEEARLEVEKMSFEQLLAAQWPSLHGIALYTTVARSNHSCAPNVKIDFPDNSGRLTATSIAPIAAGEEMCISYIDQTVDVQVRRRRLLEYGFVCSCPRCAQEDSGALRKAQKRLK